MQIVIERDHDPAADYQFGAMRIEGDLIAITQEPRVREDGLFVPGEAPLPSWCRYNVSVNYCRRFRRDLPLLSATPFTTERRSSSLRPGMRIHPGVRVHDACAEILVGRRRVGRTIVECERAFGDLFAILLETIAAGEAIELEYLEAGR